MLLLLAALVLLVTIFYLETLKPKGFPPGPPRYPFVGYIPFLDKHSLHKCLWRLSDTYGPVVGIYFGPDRAVVVHGWEAIKESLTNDDLNGRPNFMTFQLRDNGTHKGILFTEGQLWKEQRKFSMRHFRDLGFGKSSHEAVIQEEALEVIKEIQEAEGGVEIQVKLGVSAANILWAMMGGTRFQRNDTKLIDLVDRLNQVFRCGELGGGIVDILPILRHVMPQNSRFGTVMDGFCKVQKFIMNAIEEHKSTLDQENPRDFIDIYLIEILKNKNNEDTMLSEDQLVALCSDIFLAGTETGSTSVSFAVLLTTLHPEVMKKLHDELDSVVGQERLPSLNDKPNLVYTEAVITEVLRFRSSSPFTVPHSATRDTLLQGHHIPARTRVINNLYSILMDKDYWGDPEQFRPERFINNDGTFRRDERMIPFGKGRRVCLGEPLAKMTLYLLFTSLMQKFSFSIDPSVHFSDTEGIVGFTLGPPKFKVFAKSRF